MSKRQHLKLLAKALVEDARHGRHRQAAALVSAYLEGDVHAAVTIFDLLRQEMARKAPGDALVGAYLSLFTLALESIRYHAEANFSWAHDSLARLRARIARFAREGKVSASMLLLLLNAFRDARVDPGQDLARVMEGLLAEQAERVAVDGTGSAKDSASVESFLDSLVRDAGERAMDIHAAIAGFSGGMPPHYREAVVEQLLLSQTPAVRDAGALFLLDPSPEVRGCASRILGQAAASGKVSAEALRRMVAVRNWLPESERPAVDSAVKQARMKGLEHAPWSVADRIEVTASAVDGADAESAFVLLKDGRRKKIASILFKGGVGIADAWCLRGQTRAEVDDFFAHVLSEVTVLSVGIDYLGLLFRHYVAAGVANGKVPPVGALEFAEEAGLTNCNPAAQSIEDLVALIEKDLEPNLFSRDDENRLIRLSGELPSMLDFMESWFEHDAEVEAVLARRRKAKRADKLALIIEDILEPRRDKWANRFLWTALWGKSAQRSRIPWQVLFVVGREIRRGRPLKDISIMRSIAATTLEAAK